MIFKAIDDFFERRTDQRNLLYVHVFFCGAVLVQLVLNYSEHYKYFEFFTALPPHLRWRRLDFLGILPIPILAKPLFVLVSGAFALGLLLAVLGVRTRISLVVALVSSIIYNFQIFHLDSMIRKFNVVVLGLLFLSMAPDINKIGVLKIAENRRRYLTEPWSVSRWPIDLGRATLVSVYCFAGCTKLLNSGLAWANGENLQAILIDHHIYGQMNGALMLAGFPFLCKILSIVTLVWELTFPIIFIYPRVTFLYLAVGIGFHVGNLATMHISFTTFFFLIYLFFLDVDALASIFTRVSSYVTRRG